MVHGSRRSRQPNAHRVACDAGRVTSNEPRSHVCRCRLCEPGADAQFDDRETRALEIVRRHGWLVTNIDPADGLPGWSFTTGLTHSFGWPELVMTGLPSAALHGRINEVAEIARRGTPFVEGTRHEDVIDGYEVELRSADVRWNHALFGWSRWFAQHAEPQFTQVVWPDKAGRFPWDVGCDQALIALQPRLDIAPHQHEPGPWRAWAADSAWPGRERTNGLVFVSRSVLETGAPVLVVGFDDDGDWSFTDGSDTEDASDIALTHVFHILMADPTLDQHIRLQRGETAWRADAEAAWQVTPRPDPGLGRHVVAARESGWIDR